MMVGCAAAALAPVLEQARKEPGTLLYAVCRSTDDPQVFWTTEIYADQAALTAHRTTEVHAAAEPVLTEVIAGGRRHHRRDRHDERPGRINGTYAPGACERPLPTVTTDQPSTPHTFSLPTLARSRVLLKDCAPRTERLVPDRTDCQRHSRRVAPSSQQKWSFPQMLWMRLSRQLTVAMAIPTA